MCFNFQKALTTCNSRTQHANYMQSNARFSKTALFMWFIMIMHDCKKQCVEKNNHSQEALGANISVRNEAS